METKMVFFERVLCEFNWGQRKPANQLTKMEDFNPTEEQIRGANDLNEIIAKYINWTSGVTQNDKANKTNILLSQPVLAKRQIWLKSIFDRLSNERPNHPALVVLVKDMHVAVQNAQKDCV